MIHALESHWLLPVYFAYCFSRRTSWMCRQDVEKKNYSFLACNPTMVIAYRRYFGMNWNITTGRLQSAFLFFSRLVCLCARNACFFSLHIFQIPNVACTWSCECINQTIIACFECNKNTTQQNLHNFNYKLPINLIFPCQFHMVARLFSQFFLIVWVTRSIWLKKTFQ